MCQIEAKIKNQNYFKKLCSPKLALFYVTASQILILTYSQKNIFTLETHYTWKFEIPENNSP